MMAIRKIRTAYIQPPIPTTQFDWCATWDDYYDGAPDGPSHPIGNGKTELQAMLDLIEMTPHDYLSPTPTGDTK